MKINNVFNIGDVVYIRTDYEQRQRIVTGIKVRQTGLVYLVSYFADESDHYDFELSKEPNILLKLS